jgi:uncharacterized protein YidB (DUF937 family)
MGILGSLLGKFGGKIKTGNPLIDAVLPMLLGKGGGAAAGLGGLGGIMGKFSAAGLGDKAASWQGTGANAQISGDELESALGKDALGDIAAKSGMSPDAAKGGLAKLLPGLVDQMTPGGSMPAAGGMSKLMKGLDIGALKGLLG